MSRPSLLKQICFELEEFGMFPVQKAKKSAPARFVRNAPFQPKFVNAITGSVAVALEEPIQAIQRFVGLASRLNRLRKLERG
jgi:hypothetical protein